VDGAEVGTTTATGVGVVAVLAACCARRVASTTVESASASVSLDLEAVDGVESDEAVGEGWLVLPVVPPLAFDVVPGSALLASDGWLELAALLESLFAGGGGGALLLAAAALLLALLFEALLAGGGGWLSALFWDAGGGAGGKAAAELFGVFWLTRPAKRSLAGGVLARVSQAGAAWNAALAAAAESGVALTTGRPPTRNSPDRSARTGPSPVVGKVYIFQYLENWVGLIGTGFGPIFSARRQDLPLPLVHDRRVIASRQSGLY
jgi:hypothetical protein